MRGRSWFGSLMLGVIGILAGVQMSFGAGFALYEGSASGNAMGGAMIGRAEDPSQLFYNPAGITELPGFQMMGGATFIAPSTSVVTNAGTPVERTTGSKSNIWVPPHLYATYQVNDRLWAGLGVFSPFGLGTEFPRGWPGTFNSYRAYIESTTINPTVAFKVTDKLSLAVGFEAMYFDLDLRQTLPIAPLFPDMVLKGDTWGYGFNVGARYKFCNWLAAGVTYRSEVTQDIGGKTIFTAQIPGLLTNTGAKGSITLPDSVGFGLTFYPTDRFSFEVGGIWTHWSDFDQLKIELETPQVIGKTLISPKKWNDTIRVQVGGQYKTTDWLDLRAGYVYDQEPVNDQYVDLLVPANDRHLFSVGPGLHFGKWSLDLSYTYLIITDRNVTESKTLAPLGILPAQFKDGEAHLIGITAGYKF